MNTVFHEWIARQKHEELSRQWQRRDGWRLHDEPRTAGFFGWLQSFRHREVGEAAPMVLAKGSSKGPSSQDQSGTTKRPRAG